MRPLRAFLMLRGENGEWTVRVCRDLEAVLQAWQERANPGGCTGVLHIGFDRPPSKEFDPAAFEWPGRLLLSGSARHALPREFEASVGSVGAVSGIPIYVGIQGWGYTLDEVEQQRLSGVPSPPPAPATTAIELKGWVKDYVEENPSAEVDLLRAGIADEASYLACEATLKRDLRHRLGLFRYRVLISGATSNEVSSILQAAPPWLLDRSFETMTLTVRAANVFQINAIKFVRDLVGYSSDNLMRLQNFGRRSLEDVRVSVIGALDEGPPYDKDVTEIVTNKAIEDRVAYSSDDQAEDQSRDDQVKARTLIEQIDLTLAKLEERERDVLCRRMGYLKAGETLQEIGDDYDVTRERIRQIEVKAVRKLIKSAYWDDLLAAKLESLLVGCNYPLSTLGIEAVVPWFAGISRWPTLLPYLLANCCGDRIHIVKIDGMEYLARFDQSEWDYALHEARQILSSGAGHNWSEDHCKSVVSATLSESGREFRSLLWEKARDLCHFSEEPNGTHVLLSYGRGAEQLVEAILWESPEPLHYSQIAEQAASRSDRSDKLVDVRRIHNAAAAVGILLAPGTYGLEKHLDVPAEEAGRYREDAEQIILNGPEERQWHTSEICGLLADMRGGVVCNKYVLDALLQKSTVVKSLGRLAWVRAGSLHKAAAGRIDLRQAIASLLVEAGEPLSATEIKQRLVAMRGINETYQISAHDPVVKLPSGLWGLNDRDAPIKRPEQAVALAALAYALRRSNEGIHVSELAGLNLPYITTETAPFVMACAGFDAAFRVTLSQYIYLAEWGEPRRESLSEAVRAILRGSSIALSTEKIRAAAEERIRRPVDTRSISACLQAIDAKYDDRLGGRWSLPEESERADDEENSDDDTVDVAISG